MPIHDSRLGESRPRLITPEFTDRRGDRNLLIWSGIPYWMVVDDEFAAFLGKLEGRLTLDQMLAENPEWRKRGTDLGMGVGELMKKGVIADGDNAPVVSDVIGGERLIESITVNVTRHCNLKCPFCYNEASHSPISEELSAQEIIGFLESIAEHLSERAILMMLGGEPLLVPDRTLKLAEYGSKRGLRLLVSTNGTMVSSEFAGRAREIGLEVQVSLDGHTPELNDMIRGKGSFERAVKGVETLLKNGVHTILSMVCHDGNVEHLEDYYDFALRLGVAEARFLPLKMMGMDGSGRFKPVKAADLVRRVYAIFTGNPEYRRLAGRDWFSIMAATCSMAYSRKSCGCGIETFLLDADGNLYPCLNTNIPEFRIANIRAEGFDFPRVWSDSEVLGFVRSATDVETCEGPCSGCVVRHWCLGGCHGETYASKKRLDANAWNCADLKKATIEMMWVISERPDLIHRSDLIC